MAYGLWVIRETLWSTLKGANVRLVIVATCISLVYLACNATVWGEVCTALGSKKSRIKAGMIWIESESMRWLPGGVWGYTSRVVESQKLGLTKKIGTLSLTLELGFTVVAWGLIGLVGLVSSESLQFAMENTLSKVPYLKILCVLGIVGAGLIGGVGWLRNSFNVRLRYKSWKAKTQVHTMPQRRYLRCLAEYITLNLFYSVGFFLCLKGIHLPHTLTFSEVSGAYALSWIVGFFAFGAPGGMGVREGVLFLAFQPLNIGDEVVAGAILWRAIQILTELILYGGVKFWRGIERATLPN